MRRQRLTADCSQAALVDPFELKLTSNIKFTGAEAMFEEGSW